MNDDVIGLGGHLHYCGGSSEFMEGRGEAFIRNFDNIPAIPFRLVNMAFGILLLHLMSLGLVFLLAVVVVGRVLIRRPRHCCR